MRRDRASHVIGPHPSLRLPDLLSSNSPRLNPTIQQPQRKESSSFSKVPGLEALPSQPSLFPSHLLSRSDLHRQLKAPHPAPDSCSLYRSRVCELPEEPADTCARQSPVHDSQPLTSSRCGCWYLHHTLSTVSLPLPPGWHFVSQVFILCIFPARV